MMFLGEAETAVSSGIQSRFGVMDFRTSDAIWACSFNSRSSFYFIDCAFCFVCFFKKLFMGIEI